MKKRFKFTAVCLTIMIFMMALAGCSKNSPLIDLSKFQSDGQFSYPGVVWGSSAEETVEQVDALLEGTGLSAHREGTIGYVTEGVPFEGEEWRIEWQFDDDELWCISLFASTTTQKSGKLYKKLLAEFEKMYGEASHIKEKITDPSEESAINEQGGRWYSDDNETRLVLSRLYDNDDTHGNRATVGIILSKKRKNAVTTDGW